ncbi:MAG: hypothetical protein CMH83_19105 [Nocardioides sp.]|nr:hypothetical protein [Nocardioides sp.]
MTLLLALLAALVAAALVTVATGVGLVLLAERTGTTDALGPATNAAPVALAVGVTAAMGVFVLVAL